MTSRLPILKNSTLHKKKSTLHIYWFFRFFPPSTPRLLDLWVYVFQNIPPLTCYIWNSSVVLLKKKENSVKLTIKHFLQPTGELYTLKAFFLNLKIGKSYKISTKKLFVRRLSNHLPLKARMNVKFLPGLFWLWSESIDKD